MKPKKYCEYCKYLGKYPNGKKRCEREQYVQPFVEREQEACDKFVKLGDNDVRKQNA